MEPLPARPPRDTGPIELRSYGPTGRRLGTAADCYDGSPWELHRGELWEQMGSEDIHGIVMAEAVLTVLAARGLTIADAARARVLACRDPEVLGRWLALAATAPSGEAFVIGMG